MNNTTIKLFLDEFLNKQLLLFALNLKTSKDSFKIGCGVQRNINDRPFFQYRNVNNNELGRYSNNEVRSRRYIIILFISNFVGIFTVLMEYYIMEQSIWNRIHAHSLLFFLSHRDFYATKMQEFLNAGQRPASSLQMSLFHRCFSNILLVKTSYLVYP